MLSMDELIQQLEDIRGAASDVKKVPVHVPSIWEPAGFQIVK